MATIISTKTSGVGGLEVTGDATGILQLASNNGTTAVTVDASQNVTFAGSVNAPNTFGFKNRIINGAMQISQRNGTATTTLANGSDTWGGADRFKFYRDVGGTFTSAKSTTAPAGFTNSLLVTASTGASATAAQLNFFQQAIEGSNVADLGFGTSNAQTVTVSFWVRSSVTGTYAVTLGNNAADRTYVSTFSINSANTFEYKTITVPGDTAGTWTTDSSSGLRIYFDLGSGSNYNGTAGAWTAGLKLRTSGSVTWGATTGATFYLTGVQLEKGLVATSFDYRPYTTELQLCQRYAVRYAGEGTYNAFSNAFVETTTAVVAAIQLPVEMRASGTITSSGSFFTSTGKAVSSFTIDTASTSKKVVVFRAAATGMTAGQGTMIFANNDASASFLVSSEL